MGRSTHPDVAPGRGLAARQALARLGERARPVALAGDQLLAVLPGLQGVLPEGGLRRGTVVSASGAGAATSLALALAAGPSAAGSWVAAVGLPALGLVAAAEVGVALERLALVDTPPPGLWASVAATVVDAFDVVLLGPTARMAPGDARRVAARARERGCVVVVLGALGEVAADVRMVVGEVAWSGPGRGEGHLRARRVSVEVGGRGRAARPRTAVLWLPGVDGQVRVAGPVPAEAPVVPVPVPVPAAAAAAAPAVVDPVPAGRPWRQVG